MSSARKGLIAAVVVALVAASAGLFWFLRDDAPDAVSLDAATSGVEGGGDGGTAAEGIDGRWEVKPSSDVDFETASGTFVGFRVQEELSRIGSATAVGRTGDVTGSITIDGTTLTDASFEVDMASIRTNDSRRDDKVQGALDTGTFPTATFELAGPVDLGAEAATGGPVKVDAPGTLTVHGVSKTVTVPLEAELVGSTIVVVGSIEVVFSDFGVEAPTAPIVLSVEDRGILEMQLLFERA